MKRAFDALLNGPYEDRTLYGFLCRAFEDIETSYECGIRIPQKLIPKIYGTTVLWKYDLPNGWRLIYTVKGDEAIVLAIVLEWFDHRNYERRFGYG